ncbi:MAG: hypothetical protein HY686_05730 [Chloroflexi bacterium]|nr:hypothetical protein [Chloroflexota bacterium]
MAKEGNDTRVNALEPPGERNELGRTPLRTSTPLQAHFLERLVWMRDLLQVSGDREPFLVRALQRALYATYLDCVEQGAGQEAKALLRGEEHKPSPGQSRMAQG